MSNSGLRSAISRCLLAAFLLSGVGCSERIEKPETPRDLIAAMRQRYDGKWYRTLTFTQETIRFDQTGAADTSIWYEALLLPGRLRIDVAPIDSGNGLLFDGDHRYVIQAGNVVFDRDEVHPLVVLGFDVYWLPIEESLEKLEARGFDLSVMHESVWDGRPAYVVGADSGDVERAQFWIDQERLVFVRLLEPRGDEGGALDVRFEDYERIGGGWVAPTVDFRIDTVRVLLERYQDIEADRELPVELFSVESWSTAKHWYTDGSRRSDVE